MQHMELEVIQRSIGWIEQQQPIWLCTVLNTYGSSPRGPGAMMSAISAGQFSGSLSGGCVEDDFLERIANGEFRQPSQIVRYGAGSPRTSVALPCGGSIDVLVEYLQPGEESLNHLRHIENALKGQGQWVKRVTLPHASQLPEPCQRGSGPVVEHHDNEVTLYLGAVTRIIIAGLSSVGQYCAQFAAALGFEVIICEPRPEVMENFAHLDMPILDIFPARYIEQGGVHPNTAIVALTHDPRMDDLTMMEAVHTPAFYIGVMGSERTSAKRRQRLTDIGELTQDQLSRIHAPIGLPIGSKTPAEIGIAIVADIVRVKNGM
ncbi:XdhC family protein [Pragia fontium]|uniref:Xanthine dehydrogenase accessory factor n=1 Tax=Pragia fontium DSM 5563 = ATCC 49100 TaxID=1122977 RepID=A0AAJ4W9T7_9GAMM|nr:XdhC family protein [Pragia fontium]SFC62777.1 xanthine dehydrogenase accessory factor [Pragia fontium DSM 5563 = ATCC 49100]